MEKKYWIYILFCLFSSGVTFAQGTLMLPKCPLQVGDILIARQIWTNNLWDLSNARLSKEKYVDTYIQNVGDTITRIFRNTQYHYKQNNDSLIFLGYENNKSKICLKVPELVMLLPFHDRDILSGAYESIGEYCGYLYIRQQGNYESRIVKSGTLILPSGDSMKNVIHVKSKRKYTLLLNPFQSNIYDLNKSDTVAVNSGKTMHIEEWTDRLYAPGYRYPIVERQITTNTDVERGCIQDVGYYWALERPSDSIDKEQEKRRPDISREIGNSYWSPDVTDISCYIKNDVNSRKITFSYIAAIPTKGKIILADFGGIVYKEKIFLGNSNGMTKVFIDYLDLKRQPYILYIKINERTYLWKQY